MYLIDTKTLDNLLQLTDRACLLYGNRDVKLWTELEQASLKAKLETLGEASVDLAPAL